MAIKKDIEKILRKAEGKKPTKKKTTKKPAKKKASTTKKWPSGIPKSTKKQRDEAKKRNQASLERIAAAEHSRCGSHSLIDYERGAKKRNQASLERIAAAEHSRCGSHSLIDYERDSGRRNNPRHEYLIWFPPIMTDQGTMPGHYDVVYDSRDIKLAEKYGGIHVSHDDGAWAEYDRERRLGYYDGFTD